MKKYIVFGFLVLLCLKSSVLSQEKKEPPTKKRSVTEQEKKKLPELKERKYTIYGTESLKFKDADKIANEIDIFRGNILNVSPLNLLGLKDRLLIGSKRTTQMLYLEGGFRNSAYLSAGKHKDIAFGLNFGRINDEDELRILSEIKRNSGFILNTDYFLGDFNIDFTRILNTYSSANINLIINKYDYKFYSGKNDGLQRNLLGLVLKSGLNYYKWEKTKIYINGDLSYFKGENDKILNERKIRGNLKVNSNYAGISLSGNISFTFNSHKLEQFENELINGTLNYNFLKSYIIGQKNIRKNINIFGGVKYYQAEDYIENEKVYPVFGIETDIFKDFKIFAHYEPEVKFFDSKDLIDENRFLSFSTMPYYEYINVNIVSGMRKRFNKLTASGSVSYKEIENFGVYVLDNYFDKFIKIKGIKLKMQSFNFDLNYTYFDNLIFNFLGEINNVSSLEEFERGDKIPYFPLNKMTFNIHYFLDNIKADFLLGMNYIGKRFYYNPEKESLDSYYLLNFALNKRIKDNSEIFLNLNNILDEKHEYWKGYLEPDFMVKCGFKYLW